MPGPTHQKRGKRERAEVARRTLPAAPASGVPAAPVAVAGLGRPRTAGAEPAASATMLRRTSVAKLREVHEAAIRNAAGAGPAGYGRRTRLPAPRPAAAYAGAGAAVGPVTYGVAGGVPNYVQPELDDADGSGAEPNYIQPEMDDADASGAEPNYVEVTTGAAEAEPKYVQELASAPDSDAEANCAELPVAAAAAVAPARASRPVRATGTGDSRRHRAWIVSKLGPAYDDETSKSQQAFAAIIETNVNRVVKSWQALQILQPAVQNPGPDAGDGARNAALAQVGPLRPGLRDSLETLSLTELTAAVRELHSHFLQWLRRQDFAIQPNGDIARLPNGEIDMSARTVQYHDRPEDQERTKVEFKSGVLCRGEKSDTPGPVDTGGSVTQFSGPGWEIFVVSPDGEIHMTSHKIGKVHHSSLLAGGDVALGGELMVRNGKIVKMTNKSGHYMPGKVQFQQFLHHLRKDGVGLDFAISGFGVPDGTTAADLATGVNSRGKVKSSKSYHTRKLKAMWDGWEDALGEDALEDALNRLGWKGDAEFGLEDAAGQPIDESIAIKELKRELGRAPRKRREKASPQADPRITWG